MKHKSGVATESIKVLDNGYVQLIEAWGTGIEGVDKGLDAGYPSDFEIAIIEAARMSTGRGFYNWEADAKLLKYLYEHKHMTPFEMCGMTLEISAPIFVFREWHRHRTQSYNEMSGRYIQLPNENYVPSVERVISGALKAGANKQAQSISNFEPTEVSVEQDQEVLQAVYIHMQEAYEYLLSRGWPKELARCSTGVARYSRMRASANLRNWLQFLTLRLDPNAQWEIRQYAQAVADCIRLVFPRTWNLFHGNS